ncbi:MAG TPA: hypothetical protein VMS86_01150 [Thermoanaerobaculia bacterium]|nr:hypothetical protein [Thermoanaerobaculia bacterium]
MPATRKPTAADTATTADASRREQIVGWAELGLDTAAAARKQWNDITLAYADLAIQAARNGLSWFESLYEQNRKTLTSLTAARDQRARAVLERLS